jgi:hypothetical protein
MNKETSEWIVPAALAIVVAAVLWFFWQQNDREAPVPAETIQPGPVEPEAELRVGPLHPVPEIAAAGEASELQPLPALDESDEYFRLELTNLYGDLIGNLLVRTQLIGRIVATIDNLPRPHVSEKIRPVGRLDGVFSTEGQDGSGEYTLNPDNYSRYELLVHIVTSADVNAVADMYRRFYPLFQKAYVNLGYPDGYFNDRLIEVIDHLLETPTVAEPVALVRPKVLYQFADPQLEARSSGQKLLIRMGNEHAERIKQTLRALRTAVATQ